MTHDTLGLVQADRHPHLFENEGLFEVVCAARPGFCPSGDDNHVGALDGLFLQKLSHRRADTVIEAAQHSGIGHVLAVGESKSKTLRMERILFDSNCTASMLLDEVAETLHFPSLSSSV